MRSMTKVFTIGFQGSLSYIGVMVFFFLLIFGYDISRYTENIVITDQFLKYIDKVDNLGIFDIFDYSVLLVHTVI